jgi:hypothetical protein
MVYDNLVQWKTTVFFWPYATLDYRPPGLLIALIFKKKKKKKKIGRIYTIGRTCSGYICWYTFAMNF